MLGVDLGSYALKYALSEHKKGAGFECRKAGFLAFSKDVSDDIITKLQNALDKMKKKGIFKKIRDKYTK